MQILGKATFSPAGIGIPSPIILPLLRRGSVCWAVPVVNVEDGIPQIDHVVSPIPPNLWLRLIRVRARTADRVGFVAEFLRHLVKVPCSVLSMEASTSIRRVLATFAIIEAREISDSQAQASGLEFLMERRADELRESLKGLSGPTVIEADWMHELAKWRLAQPVGTVAIQLRVASASLLVPERIEFFQRQLHSLVSVPQSVPFILNIDEAMIYIKSGGPREAVTSQVVELPASETPKAKVFVSYRSAEQKMAESVAKGLRKRGIDVWIDKRSLRPGTLFQEEIERALAEVHGVAICIGPLGVGPWHKLEVQVALDEAVRRNIPVVPVILPGGPAIEALPPLLRIRSGVCFVRNVDDSEPEPWDRLLYAFTGRPPE